MYNFLLTHSIDTSAVINESMEFGDFILLWISIIVIIAWILSISFILWWGVLLILSWWKDEKVTPAIKSIRFAVLWLFMIVISIFIFPKLASLLWLDVSYYITPERIFEQIQDLWDKIFWTSNTWWGYMPTQSQNLDWFEDL